MTDIERITLKKFNTNPEWFRKLELYDTPTNGDIVVQDNVPKYCGGPWHGNPTVERMQKIHRNVEYYREYPNQQPLIA